MNKIRLFSIYIHFNCESVKISLFHNLITTTRHRSW